MSSVNHRSLPWGNAQTSTSTVVPPAAAEPSTFTPTPAASASSAVPPSMMVTKASVWDAHPREDSYGLFILARVDGQELDYSSLSTVPLDLLRFLLVQKRSTGAWSNLMNDLPESPAIPGAKQSWWVTREAQRLTDSELDRLNGTFEEIWQDETLVSVSWKPQFSDANDSFAREKYPALQKIADRIREERYLSGRVEPTDDENLNKLPFVIPKGQLQTASSVQRTPHLLHELIVDKTVREGAIREVVEETNIPASDFILAPENVEPIRWMLYPPRKVDIFLGFMKPSSTVHPSKVLEWKLKPQAETRTCKWFSLVEIMEYFQQAKIYAQSYTPTIVYSMIKRFGWEMYLAQKESQKQAAAAVEDQRKQQEWFAEQQQQQRQPPAMNHTQQNHDTHLLGHQSLPYPTTTTPAMQRAPPPVAQHSHTPWSTPSASASAASIPGNLPLPPRR